MCLPVPPQGPVDSFYRPTGIRYNPGMPTPPRRWLAFRLRTMFVVTAVAAVALVAFRPIPFDQRFSQVRIGWSESQASACLGPPSVIWPSYLAPNGIHHVSWIYRAAGTKYCVDFSRTDWEPLRITQTERWTIDDHSVSGPP